MLGSSTRHALSSLARLLAWESSVITSRIWVTPNTARLVTPQILRKHQLSSVAGLLDKNTIIKDSETADDSSADDSSADKKLAGKKWLRSSVKVKKFQDWFETSQNLSAEEKERSLKAVLKDIADDPNPDDQYTNGLVYVTIMKALHPAVNQNLMRDFLDQHSGGSYVAIYKYSRSRKIRWLEEAVKEKAQMNLATIMTGADLVTAYTHLKADLIPRQSALLVEARTLNLIDRLSNVQIIAILHQMAVLKYRSLNLIGALVFALQKRVGVVNSKQLAHLYFSCSTLNILSPTIFSCLEIMSNALLINSAEQSVSHICRIILSMGKLRWNNGALLNALCKQIRDPTELSVSQFASVLLTCAGIGVLPENIRSAVLHQLKMASATADTSVDYLRMVWCLLVFGIKSEAIFKDVLSEKREPHLVDWVQEHMATANCTMLLNIAVAARLEYNMEMPLSIRAYQKKEPIKTMSGYHDQLRDMLMACLLCDAAHVESAVWYPTGHIIDFRYLYDTKTGEVVSSGRYAAPGDIDTGDRPLPAEHMKWVAILANTFHQMTLGLSTNNPPIGRRRLAETQLRELGYHVVTVVEKAFMTDPNRERKADWLKNKIAMQEVSGEPTKTM